MFAAMFPDSLRTTRLLLRPIAPSDAGPIFDGYAQDKEVTRYLTWRPHRVRVETEAYIAHCMGMPPDVSRTYVLVDDAVRGAFDLRLVARHRLEFGYVLAREYWGLGLMTEVLTAIVSWAMEQQSVFRIGAVCDVENIASARVMENSGLIREGLVRRWIVHPNISDEPRDCLMYARVR